MSFGTGRDDYELSFELGCAFSSLFSAKGLGTRARAVGSSFALGVRSVVYPILGNMSDSFETTPKKLTSSVTNQLRLFMANVLSGPTVELEVRVHMLF